MNKRIEFVCDTCEYINRVQLGVKDYIERQTVFNDLGRAIEHLSSDDHTHYIYAQLEKEE